jgi:hypothetical protein
VTKRTLLFIIILCLSRFSSQAQNLVPNSQFEKSDTLICPPPDFVTISDDLIPWIEFGSADFLNTCDTTEYIGVPKNRFGYQYPHSGNGYTGLIAYYSTLFSREYIETPLFSSLQAGQLYYVQFYVSLEDTMQYAIENLGMLFTDTLFDPFSSPIGSWSSPQVENLPGNMLNDKLNWVAVSGSFIANGGENYVTIGNFKTDVQTVRQHLGGTTINTLGANYYIDDVYVGITPPVSVEENKKKEVPFKLYPNPNDGTMTLECNLQENESAELIIYNLTGNVVKSIQAMQGAKTLNIEASDLKTGMYLYELRVNGTAGKKNKLTIIK